VCHIHVGYWTAPQDVGVLMPGVCIANANYAKHHWLFVRFRVGRSLCSSPISEVRLEHDTLGAQITVNTRLESSFLV
jgi:hypothetical protein